MALGLGVLDAFNEGRAFGALGRYGVHVVASPAELAAFLSPAAGNQGESDAAEALQGTGEAEPLIDDYGAEPTGAGELLAAVAGRLERADDVDLFKIDVQEAGTLTVDSAGPTDVQGVLESDDGTVIAADDDGGPWYNFQLSQSVVPGTYYVRVSHCCAGTGQYRLTTALTTQ